MLRGAPTVVDGIYKATLFSYEKHNIYMIIIIMFDLFCILLYNHVLGGNAYLSIYVFMNTV